jgi:hypothetical protein
MPQKFFLFAYNALFLKNNIFAKFLVVATNSLFYGANAIVIDAI